MAANLLRRIAAARSHLFPSPRPLSTSPAVSSIVDDLSELTLLEIADLTDLLRTKLGIQGMPTMAILLPGMGTGRVSGGAKAGAAAEEKVERISFNLKLESFDAAGKIKVIKEVRAFTDLGLKEAKELVEKAPALIKKGVTKEEAERIVQKMKDVGAKVVME